MGRSQDSVGLDYRNITNQRNPTARLGANPSTIGGQEHGRCQRGELGYRGLAPLLTRKHLQTIGVYLTKLFGSNIRFRILKDLGSTKSVACVAEIVYPDKFYGTRIGIPRGVLK